MKVTVMRHTKSGAISMAAKKLKVAVEAVLGLDARIRLHSNLLRLEIQGMSIDDDYRDIQEGISKKDVPLSQLKINWMKPAHNGTQMALVEISEHAALRLLKKEGYQ